MDSLNSDPRMWANFILWICNTVLVLFIAMLSFKLAEFKEDKGDESEAKNLRIWGYFFVILALSQIANLIWRFAVSDALLIEILLRTAHTLFYVALFIRVLNIEKSLIELNWYKRYYFSAIVLISIIINIVTPTWVITEISLLQVILFAFVTLGFSVFPIIYFYVASKSSGTVRTNALKVSAGAVFLALGYLFNPQTLEGYRVIPGLGYWIDWLYITAPVSIIIGALLIYDSYRKI